jgi:DNA-binding beta-propeller fold protein YncE
MVDQQTDTKVASLVTPPCAMPNGLQWFKGELYVMDQETDDVCVIDESDKLIRRITTPTENGSGISVGGGFLWTASNGNTTSREYRDTDTHLGSILQLDLQTGEEVNRFRTPDSNGIHGIEWDFDKNMLWVTATSPKNIILVDALGDKRIVHTISCDLTRLHGLALEGDAIWCAHTTDNVIVLYDIETGAERDRITMGPEDPFVHGLSKKDGTLWFADANFAGVRHTGTRGVPAVGTLAK